jgi:hypothetical protein
MKGGGRGWRRRSIDVVADLVLQRCVAITQCNIGDRSSLPDAVIAVEDAESTWARVPVQVPVTMRDNGSEALNLMRM